jgi:hypothetical protein
MEPRSAIPRDRNQAPQNRDSESRRRSRPVLVLSGVMRREPGQPAGPSPRESAPLRGCGSGRESEAGPRPAQPKKGGRAGRNPASHPRNPPGLSPPA